MAISYVGGKTAAIAGSTATNTTVALNSGLAGGSGAAVQAGDLVVVAFGVGSNTDRTLSIKDAVGGADYTLAGSELYSNGSTYDANLRVAYKFMGSTPDASVVLGPTAATADGGSYAIHVYRGVDPLNPLDVAAATATGTASSRPDPPSVTPVSPGALVVVGAMGACATGTTAFTFTSATNLIQTNQASTNDARTSMATYAWTSGAYNPAVAGAGSNNAVDSWAAVTIALRPQMTPTGLTSSPVVGTPALSTPTAAAPAANYRSVTTANSATGDTPAGTAAGDLLIAIATIEWAGGSDIATPSGWTLIGNQRALGTSGHQAFAFYRYAIGGEPSTHTFANASWVAITRYTEAAASNPIAAFAGNMADAWDAPGPRTNPGVTTSNNPCALMFVQVAAGGQTGHPGRWGRPAFLGENAAIYYSTQKTAGATGAISASSGNGTWVTLAIAIKGVDAGTPAAPIPLGETSFEAADPAVYTKPAWLQDGDTIVAYFASQTLSAVPSGFTAIYTDANQSAYIKACGPSEPSSYTFTPAIGQNLYGVVQVFAGVDPADLLAGTPVAATGSGTSRNSAGVTTDDIETLVVTYTDGGSNPVARTDRIANYVYGFGAAFAKVQPATGASGAETFTQGASGSWKTLAFALKPLPAAAGSTELTATGVSSASAVSSATVSQRHALTATGSATPAPVAGSATLAQAHALAATGVSSSPVVGAPAAAISVALTATGISAGAPTVGTATIGQGHALTATGVATPAPATGSPAVTQRHAMTATGVSSAPVANPATISQGHALGASAVSAGAPVVGTATLAQGHAITALGITSSPAVGVPVLILAGQFAGNPLTSTPATGTPALTQRHALAATGVTASPAVGVPAASQKHAIAGLGVVAGTPSVGTASLGQAHALAATGVSSGVAVGVPTLAQAHAIAAVGVSTPAPAIGVPGIVGNHTLSAVGVSSSPSIGTATLAQTHALAAIGISSGDPAIGAAVLAQGHALTAIGATTPAPTTDGPLLTGPGILAALGVTSGAIVGRPALDPSYSLDRLLRVTATVRLVNVSAKDRRLELSSSPRAIRVLPNPG